MIGRKSWDWQYHSIMIEKLSREKTKNFFYHIHSLSLLTSFFLTYIFTSLFFLNSFFLFLSFFFPCLNLSDNFSLFILPFFPFRSGGFYFTLSTSCLNWPSYQTNAAIIQKVFFHDKYT